MDVSTHYQFLIDGDVSHRLHATFPTMTVTPTSRGCTSMDGHVADYVAIRSVMARLDSLGLTITELRKLPD
ncbi:hypothetical protein [Rhodococcus sp. 24CO]|uniref:hypothetical protein n=1 Tax=Rhodococcus sp. 24CO TaxID=3117460 RepID=UPI003D35055B